MNKAVAPFGIFFHYVIESGDRMDRIEFSIWRGNTILSVEKS